MLFKKRRIKREEVANTKKNDSNSWRDEYMKRLLLLSDDEFFIEYGKQISHPNPTSNDDFKLQCQIQHCQSKALEALKLHM